MNKTHLLGLLVVVSAASLGLVFACGDGPDVGEDCTEMGCNDSLRIAFVDGDGNSVDTFSGEVGFDGETIEFDCPSGDEAGGQFSCDGGTLVLGQASPDEVDVTVSSGDAEGSATLNPDYEEQYPNGKDCPPVCHAGEEAVTVE